MSFVMGYFFIMMLMGLALKLMGSFLIFFHTRIVVFVQKAPKTSVEPVQPEQDSMLTVLSPLTLRKAG